MANRLKLLFSPKAILLELREDKYYLDCDCLYGFYDLKNNSEIHFLVKKGVEVYGNTVPRILWNLMHPYDEKTLSAAIIHDLLYLINYERKLSDEIYYLISKYNGKKTAKILYVILRIFGRFYYPTVPSHLEYLEVTHHESTNLHQYIG